MQSYSLCRQSKSREAVINKQNISPKCTGPPSVNKRTLNEPAINQKYSVLLPIVNLDTKITETECYEIHPHARNKKAFQSKAKRLLGNK